MTKSKRKPVATELTPEQWQAIEDKVGVTLPPDIADDHNWIYTQLAKADYEKERAAERLLRAIPDEAIIKLTPQGEWDLSDNADPLIEVLQRGEADADLQAWLADKIKQSLDGRGGFAARKTVLQRIEKMGALYDAVMDVEDVERLLRNRGGRQRKVRERAMMIAAFHYEVPLAKVHQYLKRGKNTRHRLPRLE